MEQKKYIKLVEKKLQCGNAKRREIKKQIESEIHQALETGESWESVQKRMGKPEAVAAGFNRNFTAEEKANAKRAKRMKKTVLAIVIIVIVCMVAYWWMPKTKDIRNSVYFHQEEVETQAEKVIALYQKNDYEALAELASPEMVPYLTEEELDAARRFVSLDWGNFVSFGDKNTTAVLQKGQNYAFVQIHASYEKVDVLFTLIFDTDMKLAGFYMK